MPDSIQGWLGFCVLITFFGSIAVTALGCVLYYVPGKRETGQWLMGAGAGTLIITIIGLGVAAVVGNSGNVTWTGLVHFLLIVAICFAIGKYAKNKK